LDSLNHANFDEQEQYSVALKSDLLPPPSKSTSQPKPSSPPKANSSPPKANSPPPKANSSPRPTQPPKQSPTSPAPKGSSSHPKGSSLPPKLLLRPPPPPKSVPGKVWNSPPKWTPPNKPPAAQCSGLVKDKSIPKCTCKLSTLPKRFFQTPDNILTNLSRELHLVTENATTDDTSDYRILNAQAPSDVEFTMNVGPTLSYGRTSRRNC